MNTTDALRHDQQIQKSTGHVMPLLLASFAALFFELVIIRFLSTEIRVFAYLKNVGLVASFFGIGLGMISDSLSKRLRRYFYLFSAGLLLVINFATVLRLTFLPIPSTDYRVYMNTVSIHGGSWAIQLFWELANFVTYLLAVTTIMYLVVAFFAVLGGLVGEHLRPLPSLRGYSVNLIGSLAGILAFTALSFLKLPPAAWVLVGFIALVPLFFRQRLTLLIFAAIISVMAIPQANTYWSPYYRITVTPVPPPPGWPNPAAYMLDVNHLFHQRVLDLSSKFMTRYPDALQNKYGRLTYELPYRLVPHPARVLVIGAGTGNDVAAALRHGAEHVDAVEIDPVILELGRKLHPEHPYESPRVTVHINDARAFLKRAQSKYDLIVFGYLDSHTMLTSLSSIRLDNYVYTLESFRDARRLLAENGTMVLGFGGGKTFLSDRLYATLSDAFQQNPLAYFTGYDGSGVLFVVGKAAQSNTISDVPEFSRELLAHKASTLLATDHWPFLYLESRTIPVAIWSVLVLFLYFAISILDRQIPLRRLGDKQNLHFFFLGAGFMLLETKSVTELSLLFGSTWIVNSVVIASFLIMAILANTLILFIPFARRISYSCLFAVLVLGMLVPYAAFAILPPVMRVLSSAALAAVPVFFSGLIFSRSFRDAQQPAHALGVNLLGAVVGGVLENLVMVGGTPILGMLALLIYGVSAFCTPPSGELAAFPASLPLRHPDPATQD